MSMAGKLSKVGSETPNVERSNLMKTLTATPPTTETVTPTTSKMTTAEFMTPLNHPTVTSLRRRSSESTAEEQSPFHVKTPDSPYGLYFRDSPNTRKTWKRIIDSFPCSDVPPPLKKSRRPSTPLAELFKQAWKGALSTSDVSIEDMNDEPEDSGSNHLANQSRDSSKQDGRSLHSTSARGLNTSSQSIKGSQSVEARRISTGRGTPTLDDFKPYADENLETSNLMKNSLYSLKLDSKKLDKKSHANEKASEVLAELQKRLSLSKPSDSSEFQLLPQRELVSPDENPPTTQKPANVWPESQPILIGWEDPVESAERAKVFNNTSPANKDASTAGLQLKKRFIFSNVNDRENCEVVLKGLSLEEVVVSSEYDQQTTHLITDMPLRSEKLLCCIAAGKWVLHTSYVNQVAKCGGKPWPDEERYEWGNEASADTLPALVQNSLESELALAAVHWRRCQAQGGAAPFAGMRAVLVTGKVDSYRRLIEAGTGRILPNSSILEATHCFVDTNKIDHIPGGMAALVTRSVPCLPPSFLADLLTRQPPPSVQSKLLPEYKRLLSR